ncbi:hypothetical protein [Mycobacterium sp. E2733]|uniref:hypothetical protein n=1 Tax=Mycobacterium sp. E2733 TaxID=1834138 RepID=UPI000A51F4A7|nr:hypothetical protein [Mycobacterium sp. E2733]
MRQWVTSRDNASAYLAVSKEIIRHVPAAMFSIIDGLVWPARPSALPDGFRSTTWCIPTGGEQADDLRTQRD